jgi:hypothetical protein
LGRARPLGAMRGLLYVLTGLTFFADPDTGSSL